MYMACVPPLQLMGHKPIKWEWDSKGGLTVAFGKWISLNDESGKIDDDDEKEKEREGALH